MRAGSSVSALVPVEAQVNPLFASICMTKNFIIPDKVKFEVKDKQDEISKIFLTHFSLITRPLVIYFVI